jgi:tetratricopeptide (TPR) repeat protein
MDFVRRWIAGRDLRKARALEGEGYAEQALAAYEEALESAGEADRVAALRGVGGCALALGKLARARQALAEAVKLAPADPDARLLLARVCFELRDVAGAEEQVHEGLKLAPDRVDLLYAKSEIYAAKFPRAGFEAGKETLRRVVEHPDEAEALGFPRELPAVFLRNLAAEQRLADEVIAWFDEQAARGPEWLKPVLLNHKGLLLANTGRPDEAVKAYLDAISADPDFDAAHFNLGLAHARRRDFEAAKASLAVWAKKHPSDAVTTYGFGFLAETKPDVPEMIRLYGFLLERAKSNPPAPASLGRLDVARGWLKHVETVLEHAKRHRDEAHEEPPAEP